MSMLEDEGLEAVTILIYVQDDAAPPRSRVLADARLSTPLLRGPFLSEPPVEVTRRAPHVWEARLNVHVPADVSQLCWTDPDGGEDISVALRPLTGTRGYYACHFEFAGIVHIADVSRAHVAIANALEAASSEQICTSIEEHVCALAFLRAQPYEGRSAGGYSLAHAASALAYASQQSPGRPEAAEARAARIVNALGSLGAILVAYRVRAPPQGPGLWWPRARTRACADGEVEEGTIGLEPGLWAPMEGPDGWEPKYLERVVTLLQEGGPMQLVGGDGDGEPLGEHVAAALRALLNVEARGSFSPFQFAALLPLLYRLEVGSADVPLFSPSDRRSPFERAPPSPALVGAARTRLLGSRTVAAAQHREAASALPSSLPDAPRTASAAGSARLPASLALARADEHRMLCARLLELLRDVAAPSLRAELEAAAVAGQALCADGARLLPLVCAPVPPLAEAKADGAVDGAVDGLDCGEWLAAADGALAEVERTRDALGVTTSRALLHAVHDLGLALVRPVAVLLFEFGRLEDWPLAEVAARSASGAQRVPLSVARAASAAVTAFGGGARAREEGHAMPPLACGLALSVLAGPAHGSVHEGMGKRQPVC
ncbi:hypothetical protein T492DRAFT_904085 [Pavlovales sp. CCMP2436]|nr:hypothetical protein T492DRAFT_904085 [Pavlovales sp. CCMP2436]